MPGSGLGLAIVREVVTHAGGVVSAGTRDGGGAAIGFTLPLSTRPVVTTTLPPPDVGHAPR
jgi:two-component system sensor histidine kinase MprB